MRILECTIQVQYKTANHSADIILAGTNQEVGIYANGGIKVTNSKNITDNTATGSVGTLVSGGSTYTATGNFSRTTAGAAVGYYVDNEQQIIKER